MLWWIWWHCSNETFKEQRYNNHVVFFCLFLFKQVISATQTVPNERNPSSYVTNHIHDKAVHVALITSSLQVVELLTETSTRRKIDPVTQYYCWGGFRLDRHNNHIATSVERGETTVVNCPDCNPSGLADCFLYLFLVFRQVNWKLILLCWENLLLNQAYTASSLKRLLLVTICITSEGICSQLELKSNLFSLSKMSVMRPTV